VPDGADYDLPFITTWAQAGGAVRPWDCWREWLATRKGSFVCELAGRESKEDASARQRVCWQNNARLLRNKENGRWRRMAQAVVGGARVLRCPGKAGFLKIERHWEAEQSSLAGCRGAHDVYRLLTAALDRRRTAFLLARAQKEGRTPTGVPHPVGTRY
jgi:hypothetical protein